MNITRKLWRGTESDVSREEVVELTNQFYVTLRAYFARVKENGQNPEPRGVHSDRRAAEGHTPEGSRAPHRLVLHCRLLGAVDSRAAGDDRSARDWVGRPDHRPPQTHVGNHRRTFAP